QMRCWIHTAGWVWPRSRLRPLRLRPESCCSVRLRAPCAQRPAPPRRPNRNRPNVVASTPPLCYCMRRDSLSVRDITEGTVADEKRSLWYIKKIGLFQDLPAPALNKLAETVELKEVRRRQVIYLPGDPGASIFFVNGGRVKISKVTRDGKELTLAYRGPGEIFGELSLLEGGPREEMAEAMENAMVTEVVRDEFERLVQAHGMLGYRLTKVMLQR